MATRSTLTWLAAIAAASAVLAGCTHPGGHHPFEPPDCRVVADATLSDGSTMELHVINDDGVTWGHLDFTLVGGDQLSTSVQNLHCRADGGGGPTYNVADMEGSGNWNGQPGAEWAMTVHDHTPDNPDDALITIILDPVGPVLVHPGGQPTTGDIRIESAEGTI